MPMQVQAASRKERVRAYRTQPYTSILKFVLPAGSTRLVEIQTTAC